MRVLVLSGLRPMTCLALIFISSSPCVGQSKTATDINNESKIILEWVAKTYDLTIAWQNVSYPIETKYSVPRILLKGTQVVPLPALEATYVCNGTNPTPAKVNELLFLLVPELAKYPPSFVKKTEMTKIILARNLTANGKPVGGVAPPAFSLFLADVEKLTVRTNYGVQAIHHEFFHKVDQRIHRDDKGVAMAANHPLWDANWEKLNRPGFAYLNPPGGGAPPGFTAEPTDKFPGFLSRYSMASLLEERAEVFGYMFSNPDFVEKRAKADPVVKSKVNRMKAILKEYCPEMDEKYFERLSTERNFRFVALPDLSGTPKK